jgi:hypothetical protein
VWDGRIYIGTRAGYLYILGDADLAATTTSTPPTTTTTR